MYFEFRMDIGAARIQHGAAETYKLERVFEKKVEDLAVKIGFAPKIHTKGYGPFKIRVARWLKVVDGEKIYGKSPLDPGYNWYTATKANEDIADMNHYADAFRYARQSSRGHDPQEALREFIEMMQQMRGSL